MEKPSLHALFGVLFLLTAGSASAETLATCNASYKLFKSAGKTVPYACKAVMEKVYASEPPENAVDAEKASFKELKGKCSGAWTNANDDCVAFYTFAEKLQKNLATRETCGVAGPMVPPSPELQNKKEQCDIARDAKKPPTLDECLKRSSEDPRAPQTPQCKDLVAAENRNISKESERCPKDKTGAELPDWALNNPSPAGLKPATVLELCLRKANPGSGAVTAASAAAMIKTAEDKRIKAEWALLNAHKDLAGAQACKIQKIAKERGLELDSAGAPPCYDPMNPLSMPALPESCTTPDKQAGFKKNGQCVPAFSPSSANECKRNVGKSGLQWKDGQCAPIARTECKAPNMHWDDGQKACLALTKADCRQKKMILDSKGRCVAPPPVPPAPAPAAAASRPASSPAAASSDPISAITGFFAKLFSSNRGGGCHLQGTDIYCSSGETGCVCR